MTDVAKPKRLTFEVGIQVVAKNQLCSLQKILKAVIVIMPVRSWVEPKNQYET